MRSISVSAVLCTAGVLVTGCGGGGGGSFAPLTTYQIPAGNPFAGNSRCNTGFGGANDCPEIYAWGFRNPWRFSFDRQNGDLWVGDVGQGNWEEVDRVILGGNYGWRDREGAHCNPNLYPAGGCPTLGLIDPDAEYDHSVGRSITGGYVYRGSAIPDLIGSYVYGDFISGRIFRFLPSASTTEELADPGLNISSFAEANDGELYLVDYSGGTLHQIIAAPPSQVAVEIQRVFLNLQSFSAPVALLQAPGDSTRWFVVEQGGRIRVFDNNPAAATFGTFLDISALVGSVGGEFGLLGMAFDPDFATNGHIYLSYTRQNPLTSYVSRFTSTDGGQTVDAASEVVILTLLQDFSNHNGGSIAFGPGGFLFIGFGDGGGSNDPNNRAQDTTNLFGTILRIDVSTLTP